MLHFAILGAGNIAHSLAKTVNGMAENGEDICLYAVASRDLSRAQEFAAKMGVQKAYGSYEEMLADPLVDLVYIATPHSHHAVQMMQCLKAHKPVLCEKAFTANAGQAKEVINAFEEAGLFLTEAIWTRYMPSRQIINDLIASGAIGKPLSLHANLGYDVLHVERCVQPALCGGALLDIGIYPLNFADMIFGPKVVQHSSVMVPMETGCDLQESMALAYEDGTIAHLFASAGQRTDLRGTVFGSEGFFVVDNINNPHSIDLYTKADDYKLTKHIDMPKQITGYEYQVRSCMKALANGSIECPEMPHQDTIRMMALMDTFRSDWGLRYPFE